MIREMELTEQKPQLTLAIRMEVSPFELKDVMGKHFPAIYKIITSNGFKVMGQPYTLYRKFDERFDIELGLPVEKEFEQTGEYSFSKLPDGKIVKAQYYGPYGELDTGYESLTKWAKGKNIDTKLPYWEIYISDPMEVEDLNQLRTDIHVSVAK